MSLIETVKIECHAISGDALGCNRQHGLTRAIAFDTSIQCLRIFEEWSNWNKEEMSHAFDCKPAGHFDRRPGAARRPSSGITDFQPGGKTASFPVDPKGWGQADSGGILRAPQNHAPDGGYR
ncbi:hypothetical protein DESC_720014 [Desulfosarcina cetonica]|nr:hypothetical protein DESC_720014 [Desulfosarcina cetonica]